MKKRIAIALFFTLLCGILSAQVSTSLQIRQRLDVAEWSIIKGDGPNQANKDKYLGQDIVADDTYVDFSASNANAGVDFSIKIDPDSKSAADKIAINSITAWFKVGDFTLTGTNDGSRFTHELSQSIDMTNGLSLLRPHRYGVALNEDNTGNGHIIGQDADNMQMGSWSTIADGMFVLNFANLFVRAALFKTDFSQYLQAGLGFEAAFQTNMYTLTFLAKFPKAYQQIYGIYLEKPLVRTIQFVLGGTLGINSQTGDAGIGTVAYGLDARFRVTPFDALAVTVHGNFSHSFYMASNKGRDQQLIGAYAIVNANYRINDMFTAFVETGYEKYDTLSAANVVTQKNGDIKGQTGIAIWPIENIRLAASVRAQTELSGDDGAITRIALPVACNIAF